MPASCASRHEGVAWMGGGLLELVGVAWMGWCWGRSARSRIRREARVCYQLRTCLRGTPLQSSESLFANFDASLYEPRWGAVLLFLEKLLTLLPTMAACWDTEKYIKDVDFTGRHRQAQKEAEQRGEQNKASRHSTHTRLASHCALAYSSITSRCLSGSKRYRHSWQLLGKRVRATISSSREQE